MSKITNNYLPIPMDRLTKNEINVYKYIEKYNKNIFLLTSKELSKIVNCSEATITRFAQKLGFSNYKKFVAYINQEIESNKRDMFFKEEVNQQYIADIITAHKYVFEKNVSYELIKKTEELSKKIKKSKRVFVFGLGSSLAFCRELTSNLQRISVNSITPRDFHSLLPLLGQTSSDDMLILISNNLKNKELKFLIEKIGEKSPIWTITGNKLGASGLGLDYDKIISFERIHNIENKVSLSSKSAINLIIDIIFIFALENSSKIEKNRYIKGMKNIEEWNAYSG